MYLKDFYLQGEIPKQFMSYMMAMLNRLMEPAVVIVAANGIVLWKKSR